MLSATVMFARSSPKINLTQVASMQKKPSPTARTSGKRKKRSPKAKCSRASWNPGLEKGLVHILIDHDNDCYRAQNGWTSDAWNRMSHPKVSKFQRQGFPLYYDLERLHDGKTAERNLAFISIEPKDDDVRVVKPPKESHFTLNMTKEKNQADELKFLAGA
ncbi:hypothetical protein QOZ80_5BG0430440 [Eleusine coracana subsp. coracana]|nr:hypothetical protein QOZ80_5BG0430440 [Eleusine coracana subsp. coracana]